MAAAGRIAWCSRLIIAGLPPLDIMVKERVAFRGIERGEKDVGVIVGGTDVRMEGGAAAPKIHPTLKGSITFRIGENDAGPNRIYIDGSKSDEGTGAAWVTFRDGVEIDRGELKLHGEATVFQAELVAIERAMEYITQGANRLREWVVLTDSRSALLKLSYCRRPTETVARSIEMWGESRGTNITFH